MFGITPVNYSSYTCLPLALAGPSPLFHVSRDPELSKDGELRRQLCRS